MEFSDIALAKLLQTSPELGPLILTFQDLTSELPDETNIKVGAFVIRTGEGLFYVPIISRGDSVYPVDSIFSVATGKFSPLTRKTITTILANSQLSPGNTSKIPETTIQNPSLYGLITPPRTGKYVYASSSRMTEFLAAMPDLVKKATIEEITANKNLYSSLDSMFGLKTLFEALAPNLESQAANALNASVENRPNKDPEAIKRFLETGSWFDPAKNYGSRIALSKQDFNQSGKIQEVSEIDGSRDYNIAFKHSDSRHAFVPLLHSANGLGNRTLAIFTDGSYAVADSFISVGDTLPRKKVLNTVLEFNPPVLLKDCYNDDVIAISTSTGKFLGPFRVQKAALNQYGVELSVSSRNGAINRVRGYRNFLGEAERDRDTLYVPSASIVIKLGEDVTFDIARCVMDEQRRQEMELMSLVNKEINIGFDGVEYSIDHKPIGAAPKVIEILVTKENIAPEKAQAFVKEAELNHSAKIYLSKVAESTDFNPAEVPQFGQVMPETKNGSVLPNGSFIQSVQSAVQTNDSQAVEATVLSELLQVPDLYELIEEYVPDIEEAIDRLGRILFLCRVHITKLAEGNDPDSVFAFLAQIKAVYRMLGDNLQKLKELTTLHKTVEYQQ